MENSKFIAIHLKNNIDNVKEYINTYESSKCHNYLQNIFFNTPYLSDVVRLIQAENSNIKGNKAWTFKMDYSKDAIYNSLKYKMNELFTNNK